MSSNLISAKIPKLAVNYSKEYQVERGKELPLV
jgi:hypothetical protein